MDVPPVNLAELLRHPDDLDKKNDNWAELRTGHGMV